MELKFGKLNSKGKKRTFFRVDPHLHWKRVMMAAGLLVVLGMFFGGYMFWRVSVHDFKASQDAQESTKPLKRAKLEAVLEYYKEKRERHEALLLEKIPVVDPSL